MDPPEYSTGAQCLKTAKTLLAEDLCPSAKMRKMIRPVVA